MRVEGHQARQALKEWAWSYSKLKNYEECPKRHYEVDIAKTHVEEASTDPDSALNWGNRVHETIADVLRDKRALPAEMEKFQRWIDVVKAGPGKLFVEQKYAITRAFKPTQYFANDVWYRGIGDVVRIDGPVALAIDWKTGKILEDSVQLMLMAQCLFSHFPQLKKIRSEFVWLKEDCSTPEVYDRQEVARNWVGLMDRVNMLELASKTMNYPPKPGRLCRSYCPVQSCPFYKKGQTSGRN
jgi:PD-(D/E)XK nuclease superfamily